MLGGRQPSLTPCPLLRLSLTPQLTSLAMVKFGGARWNQQKDRSREREGERERGCSAEDMTRMPHSQLEKPPAGPSTLYLCTLCLRVVFPSGRQRQCVASRPLVLTSARSRPTHPKVKPWFPCRWNCVRVHGTRFRSRVQGLGAALSVVGGRVVDFSHRVLYRLPLGPAHKVPLATHSPRQQERGR